MPLVNYYKRALKNYTKFDGRDSRKQYWMFVLANFIVSFLLGLIPFVGWIYCLAVLVPGVGASIRRMHDTGKSGWYVLVALIPFVGWIIEIVLLAQPGEAGDNAYGEVPYDEFANTPI